MLFMEWVVLTLEAVTEEIVAEEILHRGSPAIRVLAAKGSTVVCRLIPAGDTRSVRSLAAELRTAA